MTENFDKKIGLWLDHHKAYFIDFTKMPATLDSIYSDMEANVRYGGETGSGTRLGNNRATNNEKHRQNREREQLHHFYNLLADRLKHYNDIFLFGASTAKDELFNKLTSDKSFAGKNLNVRASDYLSEDQMIAEARKHFNV